MSAAAEIQQLVRSEKEHVEELREWVRIRGELDLQILEVSER